MASTPAMFEGAANGQHGTNGYSKILCPLYLPYRVYYNKPWIVSPFHCYNIPGGITLLRRVALSSRLKSGTIPAVVNVPYDRLQEILVGLETLRFIVPQGPVVPARQRVPKCPTPPTLPSSICPHTQPLNANSVKAEKEDSSVEQAKTHTLVSTYSI